MCNEQIELFLDLTLVIEVTDTNDNPPCFKAASKPPPCFSNSSEDSLVFGVPKGAKPGDLVGVIQVLFSLASIFYFDWELCKYVTSDAI